MDQSFCRVCKTALTPSYNFCPNCGLKVHEGEATVSMGGQIGLYLLSFFLPPLGLFPGIKYLRRGDEHARHVGLVAIFLTILSTVLTLWAFAGFLQAANSTLNQQMNLRQLGY